MVNQNNPNGTVNTQSTANHWHENGSFLEGADEISLIDILIFLKGAWKTIAITGVLGLLISVAYLLITTNQFEALANISMMRVSPAGANIEEPAALIARMSLSTNVDDSVMAACDLQDAPNMQAQFTKAIRLSIPKGVANVVELKVTRPSPELANACAMSLIKFITNSQTLLNSPNLEASKVRLAKVDERLAEDKVLLSKIDPTRGPASPSYFAILQEIRNLEDEREKTLKILEAKDMQATNLQFPIDVANKPVYPKKTLSLIAGLLGGLFFGFLIALSRQMLVKLKSEVGGAL
jgi:capsular polysaccharide biosynthesis protein